jgi:hypothetical protein
MRVSARVATDLLGEPTMPAYQSAGHEAKSA